MIFLNYKLGLRPEHLTDPGMRPKTIIAVAATIALVGGGVYAWTEYNRGVGSADSMPVTESVTATELFDAFSADEQAATAKFVGMNEQVVQVSGSIRSVEPTSNDRVNVTLETGDALAGVVCEFEKNDVPSDWKPGDDVSIKGICTGMLLDIVLIRCKKA